LMLSQENMHFNKRVFILISWILALKLPMWLARMNADGGVFASYGIGLIRGELPYRDWWDFKLPGVPILNGFGAFLFGQTPTGIRIFELLWIFVSVLVFDRIVKRIFNALPFSLPTFIFTALICSWALVRYGNAVTLWEVLPWLLAIHFWLTIVSSGEKNVWRNRYIAALYFGMSLAWAFVIRPSATVPAVFLITILFFSRHIQKELGLRKTFSCLALSIIGAGVIIGALVLWLSYMGVLSEALKWLRISAIYLKAGWSSSFRAREGMDILRNTTLAIVPLFLILFASFFYRSPTDGYTFHGALTRKILLVLVGLKFAVNMSGGRLYNHYFMELVPELALLAGPLFLTLEKSFYQKRFYLIDFSQKLGLIGVGMLLVFQLLGSAIYLKRFLTRNTKVEMELVEYIQKYTSVERKYFSWWGYDSVMFHLVDRHQICPLKFNWLLQDISSIDQSLSRKLGRIMADRLAREKPPIVLLTDGEYALIEMEQYAPEVLYVIQKFYLPGKHFDTYWVWRRKSFSDSELSH